jgi:hypothetical protein
MSLCSTLLACNTASACTPTVADIADICGITLVPDVLNCYWSLSFSGFPGVVGIHVVAFVPAVAHVPAVVGFPAVAGILAVASVHVDPGVPILACVFAYCTVQ